MSLHRETGRQNSPPGELFSVYEFIEVVRRLGCENGFSVETFAAVGDFSLPVLVRDSGNRDWLYVSSAVHGDEPAGPLGIKKTLEEKGFSDSFNWMIFPVLNPTGLAIGTRESSVGVDLNRDYKTHRSEEVHAHCRYLQSKKLPFLAALGLHEDWEAGGGYLYEHNRNNQVNPGQALLRSIEGTVGLEPGDEIDGWPTEGKGLIHPPSDPDLRDAWPEQIYLLHHNTAMSYTVETPSMVKLAARIECHKKAILAFGDAANWVKS